MAILKEDQFIGLAAVETLEEEEEEEQEKKGDHDWPEDVARFLDSGDWNSLTHSVSTYKKFVSQFKIMGDRLYRLNESGWPSLYLPVKERREVLTRFHDNLGHLGAESILHLIKRRYYWLGLVRDLKLYVKSCNLCQLARSRGGAPKPLLPSVPPVAFPFERISLDFLSNLPLTKQDNRHCITCIDYASRWVWAVPVPDMSAQTVIWFLYNTLLVLLDAHPN